MENYLTKNLRFLFQKNSISVYELAIKTNGKRTTLNSIVNGTTTNPKLDNLIIIYNELKNRNLINSLDDLIFKDLTKTE